MRLHPVRCRLRIGPAHNTPQKGDLSSLRHFEGGQNKKPHVQSRVLRGLEGRIDQRGVASKSFCHSTDSFLTELVTGEGKALARVN